MKMIKPKKIVKFSKRKDYNKNKQELKKLNYKLLKFQRSTDYKYFNVDHSQTTITTGGIVSTSIVAGLNLGVGESQRIGNLISVSMLEMKMNFDFIPDATVYEDELAWYLILDKQPNGADPSVTDYLTTANYYSFKNKKKSSRFKTLRKGVVVLRNASIPRGGTSNKGITQTVPVLVKFDKPLLIQYKDTGNGIADVSTHNLSLITISANGKARYKGTTRIWFTDY